MLEDDWEGHLNTSKELLDIKNFRLAGDIDQIVPDRSGIYAIRIKNIDELPSVFSEVLNKRGTI